jgi:hypothetical protein
MLKKTDYSTWLTKQQTADALQVSTKQVERFAHAGRLQSSRWKRPQGGPVITVYHPQDVERLARERNPEEPFVLPAASPPAPNGTPAVAVRQPATEQFLEAMAAAVRSASQTSETQVRLTEKLYLTIDDAARLTGLGAGYLRRQVAAGKLELVKGAGPRGADVVRRKDLERV